MSQAPVRFKQPAEVRKVTFDFGTKLNTGDSVSAVVGGALEVAPAGLTAGAPSITGNKVTSLLSVGTGRHRVSCRVTTTLGETLELDVDIQVTDGEN